MNDPYADMAQWLDMDARAESMLRHPAGRRRGKDFSGVDWKAMYEQACRERDETDFALFTVRDQLKQCRGEREQMTRARDEWRARAEAAEARTAPAVDDPALYVIRESDVAAVKVTRNRGDLEGPTLVASPEDSVALMRDAIRADLRRAAEREAIARASEAVPADPVEQKAAGWAAAVGIDWGHAEPEDVDLLMKVAAHILGQEADQ